MVYVLAVSGDGEATARMVLLWFRAAAVAAALRRMVAAAERGRRADKVPPAAAAPRRCGPRLWLVVCVLAIRGVIAARVPPTANVADAERCKDAMVGCACVAQ